MLVFVNGISCPSCLMGDAHRRCMIFIHETFFSLVSRVVQYYEYVFILVESSLVRLHNVVWHSALLHLSFFEFLSFPSCFVFSSGSV